MCVCVPHGMIHHGADPNPGFEKLPLLEAFPFGNLGRLVLDVHHPSPGPMLQTRPAPPSAQTADAFHGQKLKLGG